MAEEFKKVSAEELEGITGGVNGKVGLDMNGPWKEVSGLKTGWLALRTDPVYDFKNEIGQLYNGDKVQIIGNGSGQSSDGRSYIWVYSKRLDKSGWVNDSFLK
ncbi:MAG: hypothetical protein Q4F43_01355 [Eubacteriales bacterium]|nr:hypothetical protein [Eubacteriales bacterium]